MARRDRGDLGRLEDKAGRRPRCWAVEEQAGWCGPRHAGGRPAGVTWRWWSWSTWWSSLEAVRGRAKQGSDARQMEGRCGGSGRDLAGSGRGRGRAVVSGHAEVDGGGPWRCLAPTDARTRGKEAADRALVRLERWPASRAWGGSAAPNGAPATRSARIRARAMMGAMEELWESAMDAPRSWRRRESEMPGRKEDKRRRERQGVAGSSWWTAPTPMVVRLAGIMDGGARGCGRGCSGRSSCGRRRRRLLPLDTSRRQEGARGRGGHQRGCRGEALGAPWMGSRSSLPARALASACKGRVQEAS